MSTQDIVAKLWRLCDILRDDGITYHQYVTELTYLLFLKMAKETGTERQLPAGYRWDDLEDRDGVAQLTFYRQLLLHLGTEASPRVQAIYANAATSMKPWRLRARAWHCSKREDSPGPISIILHCAPLLPGSSSMPFALQAMRIRPSSQRRLRASPTKRERAIDCRRCCRKNILLTNSQACSPKVRR